MADLRNDWISLVGGTLSVTAWVDMDIGNDAQASSTAMSPQSAQSATVDLDDPAIERLRIDIVIVDELFNCAPLAPSAEEKCAGLAPPVRTPPQFRDTCPPDRAGADEFRRRPEGDARER